MKNLKNINIYEGGISSIPGKKNVVKVSSNESPFGPVSYTHLTLPTKA